MRYIISGLRLSLDEPEDSLVSKAALLLGIGEGMIASWRVLRRSLDARRRRPPVYVYNLEITLAGNPALLVPSAGGIKVERKEEDQGSPGMPVPCPTMAGSGPDQTFKGRTVVVGAGPAGLFAALALAARGVPVLLLERGRRLEERIKDVEAFWQGGRLDPESNVQFGEGGAGAFSDGKLTSRANHPDSRRVKEILVELGAPASIITEAKPHIGTDRLRMVLLNFRQRLLSLGCELRFKARVTDFLIHHGRLAALLVNDREEIAVNGVILAIGQSGRDTYEKLQIRGIRLEAKPFAMGLRIEHPQGIIDRLQYGRWTGQGGLPPAEYVLKTRIAHLDRYAYSFCMCPGGTVIGAASEPGYLVVNGMSDYKRDAFFGNSALVVNVRTSDFPGDDPLGGLLFRAEWEGRAFRLGGGNYRAPAQDLMDFLQEGSGRLTAPVSYRPGATPADLREVLPAFVSRALRAGIGDFRRMMPGFICPEATLLGVETRTSSPVRICRDQDGLAVGLSGLYPCGEGAGYAGGIISSAIDGINAVRSFCRSVRP